MTAAEKAAPSADGKTPEKIAEPLCAPGTVISVIKVLGLIALSLLILLGVGCAAYAAFYDGPSGSQKPECEGNYRKLCLSKCLCAYCLQPPNTSERGYCVPVDDSDDCEYGHETLRYGKSCTDRLLYLDVVTSAFIVLALIVLCGACAVAGEGDPLKSERRARRTAAHKKPGAVTEYSTGPGRDSNEEV